MNRPKIVRLYGRAGSFDIEFTHKGGTIWTAKVPPDTDDGVYSVELTAVNELGETAYWTGELYMCGGVCHMEIMKNDYVFWFAPLTNVEISSETSNIYIRKGCPHD